jgi:hypothetical protein
VIFAHTLEQVLREKKSQTRRVIKAGEELTRTGVALRVESHGKRTVYQVGKSYAVQPGRGKKSVARIVLTGIRREPVNAISHADARAEGFASREAFLSTWHAIHGAKADLSQEVWVLEFRLEVIIVDRMKMLYGNRKTAYGRPDHCHDIPAPFAGLSGVGVHSGHYPFGRVGAPLSDRLPLPLA